MTRELRFDVFGKEVVVMDSGAGWSAFTPGNGGILQAAEFQVPDYVDADDLCTYLADLFHALASPGHPGVRLIHDSAED